MEINDGGFAVNRYIVIPIHRIAILASNNEILLKVIEGGSIQLSN